MNKSEQAQEKTKDVFATYKDVVDKAFNSINQAVPRYNQSIANTQQEIFKTLESNVASAIEIQKDIAAKIGISTTIPEASVQAVKDTAESYIKITAIGNQIALATIDAAQQNVKTASENVKAFNDINKNTMRSWIKAYAVTN